MQHKLSAVISAYGSEGITRAFRLAATLEAVVGQIVIVINCDRNHNQKIYQGPGNYIVLERPNSGMNIGAWAAGVKLCAEENSVICLQDECQILDLDFANQYTRLLQQQGVGMVGESFNPKWGFSWNEIKKQPFNYPIKFANGQVLDRVTYYLTKLIEWEINPGHTGAHLRSLVWGFSAEAKRSFCGLSDGRDKEECIALEIGVSKLIENNLGLKVIQSAEAHFAYITHLEWRSDGLSKIPNPPFIVG